MDSTADLDCCVNDLKPGMNLKFHEDAQNDRNQLNENNKFVKESFHENGNKISDSTETNSDNIADSANIILNNSIGTSKISSCQDEAVVPEFEMLESTSVEVAESSTCFPVNGSTSETNEEASLNNVSTKYRCTAPDPSWSEDDDSSSTLSTSSDDNKQVEPEPARAKPQPKVYTVKTHGELELKDLPPVENVNISVTQEDLEELGQIHSYVNPLVVVQSLKTTKPLDMESVLFLSTDKPLGRVFEVFGSIYEPFYTVRFNSNDDIHEKGVKEGAKVFYAPNKSDITSFVFMAELQSQKGSDASWEDNNEPPEEYLDYSDDEKERFAKKKRSLQKFKRKMNDAVIAADNDVRNVSPPVQAAARSSESRDMKQNLKRKQPTTRGRKMFHHSQYDSLPSTSHNNGINNNFQCSQASVISQQPIIHPARFSLQHPLRSPMPPPSYAATPLPVNSPPPFPPPQFSFHQPNSYQTPPQPPIHLLATYHTTPMYGQIPAIAVSSGLHRVAVHPPLLNSVPALIPAQTLPPTPEHYPQRISQAPSPSLQNHFPPNSLLQIRSPLHIAGNLPPNAPLSVQIPPFNPSPNPINLLERPPFPRPAFPQPEFPQHQWPQPYPNQNMNFSNGSGYPRFR